MSAVYSIELPDNRRVFTASKVDAMSQGSSRSHALESTIIVREHRLADLPARTLACALLNGDGFEPGSDIVIGWFSNGKRRRVLEDRR